MPELTVDHVRSFRGTWNEAPITSQKRLERLRSAFQFFVDCDWIAKNPARSVKSPITHLHAVEPFTADEQALILSTAYRLAQTQAIPANGGLPVNPKTGTFANLLRSDLHSCLSTSRGSGRSPPTKSSAHCSLTDSLCEKGGAEAIAATSTQVLPPAVINRIPTDLLARFHVRV